MKFSCKLDSMIWNTDAILPQTNSQSKFCKINVDGKFKLLEWDNSRPEKEVTLSVMNFSC